MGLDSKCRLLPVPANIRVGWKWRVVANNLAYYDAATVTVIKSFIVQAIKSFIVQSPAKLIFEIRSSKKPLAEEDIKFFFTKYEIVFFKLIL